MNVEHANLRTSPLRILYEDACCIVVDKPSGIATIRTELTKASETTVTDLLSGLLPAHRLDRGTSGCLLLARGVEALADLQRQFRMRTVSKSYLAIVEGHPEERQAVIDAPIGRKLTERTRMSLFTTGKQRKAETTYHTVAKGDRASLLVCRPRTGRTHQIRVHLAAIGHPILGDDRYGSPRSEDRSRTAGIGRLCLHAHALMFTSPATGEKVEIRAPVPEEFCIILHTLGIAWKE